MTSTAPAAAVGPARQEPLRNEERLRVAVVLGEEARLSRRLAEAARSYGAITPVTLPVGSDLATWLDQTSPDVVILTGWPSSHLRAAAQCCRRRDLPTLYHADNSFARAAQTITDRATQRGLRRFLRDCWAYLGVGARSRMALLRHGASAERIFILPDLFDDSAIRANDISARQRRVLHTLGFDPTKPLAIAIDEADDSHAIAVLLSAVRRNDPDMQLMVACADATAGAASAGSSEARIVGNLSAEERHDLYRAAAYVIVRRNTASLEWSPYESMALGCPCVMSDAVDSAADLIVSGETGERFDADDPSSLAEAIRKLRSKQAAGFRFGPQCRARVARYFNPNASDGLVAACGAAVASCRAAAAGVAAPHRVLAACGASVVIAGMELATFDMLRAMTHQGVRVHCVLNEWENIRLTAPMEDVGATWSTGTYGYRLDRSLLTLAGTFRTIGGVLRTSMGLLRDAWKFRPSHVLLAEHISAIRNAPALLLLRACGIRVVLRLHNGPSPSRFQKQLWRWGVGPLVDYLVPNSAFTRDETTSAGIPARKVTSPIYPTSEATWTDSPEAQRDFGKVVYVGQTIPEKGLHLLLEAVGELIRKGLDIRLDVVGPMDGWEQLKHRGYRQSLLERANQPDLASRVRFLGYRPDVLPVLATAGVHCCPSLLEQREAFGRVVVEAKVAGVPTVTFPFGALPELITHGVDGWICQPASVSTLADGLARFLNNPERIQSAGAAARASAARFVTSESEWMRMLDSTLS